MDAGVLHWLTVSNTNLLGFATAGLCLAVRFTVFLGAWPRVFLALTIALALAAWVVFQNFSGIYTGATTDVGTGPVLVLLAAAFWPVRGMHARRVPGAGALTAGAGSR